MIEKRIVDEALYIIETHSTVRATAEKFNISKSTVHKDVSQKLKYINMNLYNEVKLILDDNFREKHIRGGLATKAKFATRQ